MKLTEGLHQVQIKCPECGRLTVFPVEIAARLTVDSGNGGKLSPKFKAKAADHSCDDNNQLPFADE